MIASFWRTSENKRRARYYRLTPKGRKPITYELDGRQYVVIGGGSSLFAFALPQ